MAKKDRVFVDPFESLPNDKSDEPPPPRKLRTEIPPDPVEPPQYEANRKGRDAADHNPKVDQAVKDVGVAWNPDALVDRLVRFCEEISGIPNFRFYEYQKEFAKRLIWAVLNNEAVELTVLIARQSGKTEVVCDVIVGLCILMPALAKVFPDKLGQFSRGFWVGVFAPRDWQVQTDVERISARMKAPITKEIMSDPELGVVPMKKLVLSNGSQVFAHTASPMTFVESKTVHLLVVEEAQDMDKMVVQKSLQPMLASTAGVLLKIGTSNTKRCEFLEAIGRNKRKSLNFRDWRKRQHFEYDYRICQQYSDYYRRHIEREKETLGEDSDAFRMSYGLVWILERGMFISPLDMDALEDPKREALTACDGTGLSVSAHLVAGLDIGKSKDSTILTIGAAYPETRTSEGFMSVAVLAWFEFLGDDHESQYHQIVPLLREFRVKSLAIDSTGMGDVHADRYAANMPNIAVIPTVFSLPMKSQLYKTLDREMRAKRISIPGGPNTRKMRLYKRFRFQMETLEKEYKGAYMVCHHPKDDADAHDDYPDSLALMLHAAYNDAMPQIEHTMASLLDPMPGGGGRRRNWILRG